MTVKEVEYFYKGLRNISREAYVERDHGISCGMYRALAGVYDIIIGMCDPRNMEQEGAENGKDD